MHKYDTNTGIRSHCTDYNPTDTTPRTREIIIHPSGAFPVQSTSRQNDTMMWALWPSIFSPGGGISFGMRCLSIIPRSRIERVTNRAKVAASGRNPRMFAGSQPGVLSRVPDSSTSLCGLLWQCCDSLR